MNRVISMLVLVAAASCPGAYLVGNVGSDTAFNTYMQGLGFAGYQNLPAVDYSQELYAAQGRIGNNATTGNNELGLHRNLAPLSDPPTNSAAITPTTGSTQRQWGAATLAANVAAGALINALVDFTFARVGNTTTLTFQSGSTVLHTASITDVTVPNVNFLVVRARSFADASTTSSRVKLDNIVLNGIAYGSMGNVTTTAGTTTTTNYVFRDVVGDFTMTGQTTLDWSGTTPTNSAIAWQVKGYVEAVPEPATFALAGVALVACGMARRRS
jgi:hypothetical protein